VPYRFRAAPVEGASDVRDPIELNFVTLKQLLQKPALGA
jgi:hypothetical protein